MAGSGPLLEAPEVVMAIWRAAKAMSAELEEATVRQALDRFDPLWEELFPAEHARIVLLLVQRTDSEGDGFELRLRATGSDMWSGSLAPQAAGAGGPPYGHPRFRCRHHQGAGRDPQARWPQACAFPKLGNGQQP